MTWMLFDWAGTLAFAVSGAMVGLSRRMDIFGVTVLALLTAVGGGMVRDVLAGITPPVALTEPTDLLLSVVMAVLVSGGYAALSIDRKQRHTMTLLYELSDTIGLASFTVTGSLRRGLFGRSLAHVLELAALGSGYGILALLLLCAAAARLCDPLRMAALPSKAEQPHLPPQETAESMTSWISPQDEAIFFIFFQKRC